MKNIRGRRQAYCDLFTKKKTFIIEAMYIFSAPLSQCEITDILHLGILLSLEHILTGCEKYLKCYAPPPKKIRVTGIESSYLDYKKRCCHATNKVLTTKPVK